MIAQKTGTPPFELGSFPASIFPLLHEELVAMGVALFAPTRPEPRPVPTALILDGSDFIIADDFEIELPEWEHRDEWFAPSSK